MLLKDFQKKLMPLSIWWTMQNLSLRNQGKLSIFSKQPLNAGSNRNIVWTCWETSKSYVIVIYFHFLQYSSGRAMSKLSSSLLTLVVQSRKTPFVETKLKRVYLKCSTTQSFLKKYLQNKSVAKIVFIYIVIFRKQLKCTFSFTYLFHQPKLTSLNQPLQLNQTDRIY